MSDWADQASDREQELRDDALVAQARRSSNRYVEASAEFCAICGESIPEARRRAVVGVQTCVECQSDLERALKQCVQTCVECQSDLERALKQWGGSN